MYINLLAGYFGIGENNKSLEGRREASGKYFERALRKRNDIVWIILSKVRIDRLWQKKEICNYKLYRPKKETGQQRS